MKIGRIHRLSIFLLAFALGMLLLPSLKAQEAKGSPINLILRSIIDNPPEGVESAHLMVAGDLEEIKQQVTALGGHYKYTFRNYASVIVPLDQIDALAACDCVDRIEVSSGAGQVLNDKQLTNNKVWQIHSGLGPLPEAYKGNGVLMGVIDSGLELNHADFKTSDDKTRVVELWDQRMSFNAQRTPFYGYGQIWDSASINAGICPHDDFGSFGHGTNVAGIAAGNGLATGQFRGTAPETELIIVATNFAAINWTVTVAEAMDYIFRVADSLDRPCVINASIGTYLGSHDGRDLAAQMIDTLLEEKNGRVVVCAAGNAGSQDPFHLGYSIGSDTSWTWFEDPPNSNLGVDTFFFEFWADTADFNNVYFGFAQDSIGAFPVKMGSTPFDNVANRLNQSVSEDLMVNGNKEAEITTWVNESEGRYRFQVLVEGNGSPTNRYRFMTTGSGRFDCWSAPWLNSAKMIENGLPSQIQFPEIQYYQPPDINQSIVSSWACSPRVLTVGNYINRTSYVDVDGNTRTYPNLIEGNIADDSSYGPARTGALKPEITSPGGATLAASESNQLAALLASSALRENVASSGLHNVNGGTSMASPGIAGISALFLEKCPEADFQDVRDALAATARQDVFTGIVPNNRWGNGKADGFESLLTSNFSSTLRSPTAQICIGDTVAIEVSGSYNSYFWSTGDTTASIEVEVSGLYHVQLTNDMGCKGFSDTLNFIAHALPPMPSILPAGPHEFCEGESIELEVADSFGAYNWNNGAHTNSIEVTNSGSYVVEVVNVHNCARESAPVEVNVLPVPDKPIVTYQNGELFATLNSNLSYQWYDEAGKLDLDTSYFFTPPVSGKYRVEVTGENGCSSFSDEFWYLPTSIDALSDEESISWRIYPNPAKEQLTIQPLEGVPGDVVFSITDVLGRNVWTERQQLLENEAHVLSLESQPAGIYHLKISQKDTTTVLRFVIQ